ncbi:MAG: hypothetical protein KF900_04685 [Bacteroidetes bacterium]|nr:hypothetical protein [Bacteroidota bacterium]
MKYLTKTFCLLFMVATLLSSCTSDPKQKLVGKWAEHWGIGTETDIQYVDTIQIQLTTDDNIIMSCVNNKTLQYDNIIFDGNELSFRMENISDPNEKFYVYYKLKVQKNGNWMDGSIENSRNKKNNIKLEKVK